MMLSGCFLGFGEWMRNEGEGLAFIVDQALWGCFFRVVEVRV